MNLRQHFWQTWFDWGDIFSNALNNSSPFMSKDHRENSFWIKSIQSISISVTNTSVKNLQKKDYNGIILKELFSFFVQDIWYPNTKYGCAGSIKVTDAENGIGKLSNSCFAHCIHFHTKGKSMMPAVLLPDLNSWIDWVL